MNRDIIIKKLESLARCVQRIEKRLPAEPESLAHDYDAQDIITVNLERAVQLCVDIAAHLISEREARIPETMAGLFRGLAECGIIDNELAASLAKAVGLRNLAVHEYSAIDWQRLGLYLPAGLDDFRRFARQLCVVLGMDEKAE